VDVDHIGAKGIAGRATVSEAAAHTIGVIAYGKIVWSWRPQAGVKRCGDACCPTGHAHRQPQGDGGNSATLPEESTT